MSNEAEMCRCDAEGANLGVADTQAEGAIKADVRVLTHLFVAWC